MVYAWAIRMTEYVELQVTTNFSFLRGASHPAELVFQAAALGHPAIAVTDRNSLAGVVRAHVAAKEVGIELVVGARLDLADGAEIELWGYVSGTSTQYNGNATLQKTHMTGFKLLGV